ncbi:hypothetical protein VKT23_019317 [Stygiomarasmius scandens]|uniref:Uncharacterized protein n=1 Tax=Marasmiellus scandens TaxID=2682957 RepID=A0ABR1IQR4_9AGAR
MVQRRLHEHTEDSVRRRDPSIQHLAQKYNRLVKEMKDLIIIRKAPRNAVAPQPIDISKLFNLDVDDEIWQDIGLNYDEASEGTSPPPWLADENVRKGIQAMLELDRCEEEEERLAVERKAMKTWFEEEWEVVATAITGNPDDRGLAHQLGLRRKYLCRLYVLWQDALIQFPEDWEESWGPSEYDIREARLLESSALVDYIDEEGCDVSFEIDVDPVLTEQLETVALAEEYRWANQEVDSFDVVVD